MPKPLDRLFEDDQPAVAFVDSKSVLMSGRSIDTVTQVLQSVEWANYACSNHCRRTTGAHHSVVEPHCTWCDLSKTGRGGP